MNDAQRVVVAALSRWLPPMAAEHLLRKTLDELGVEPDSLSANEWARLLNGPLARNLQRVLPVPGIENELAAAAKRFAVREPIAHIAPFEPTPGPRSFQVNKEVGLLNSKQRLDLIQELARLDHVQGVALLGPNFQEIRFPGSSPTLIKSLEVFLDKIGKLASSDVHDIVYMEMQNGTLIARRLGQSSVILFVRPGANIGQLLYSLNSLGKTRRY